MRLVMLNRAKVTRYWEKGNGERRKCFSSLEPCWVEKITYHTHYSFAKSRTSVGDNTHFFCQIKNVSWWRKLININFVKYGTLVGETLSRSPPRTWESKKVDFSLEQKFQVIIWNIFLFLKTEEISGDYWKYLSLFENWGWPAIGAELPKPPK